MAVHIGKLIEQELKKQNRGKVWFANQICCTRANVYHILKSESIDCNLLKRISIVLKVNFLSYLANDTDSEISKSELNM